MDKLRKYIQECWGDIVYSDYDKVATLEDLEYNYRYIRFLLSTEAMFIKWLVENEKIEWRKVIEKEIESWLKLVRVKDFPNKVIEEDKEELLMLLSIQDNPIEFLVSILK